MSRTTPPRPLDTEALFPELAAHRGTTTRLHPRPGRPEATDSSVGGPLLWPADLLLTVDSSQWDGGSGSWKPQEEPDLPLFRSARPTEVTVGRSGELNVFACPERPGHPHRWCVQ
ncbi:hypothetical protein ACIRRX_11050 [Streptomyces bacillaris]